MERVESIVEAAGLGRVWFRAPDGNRVARFERGERTTASFESQLHSVLGADIVWDKADGSLSLTFGERDTRLSARGEQVLQDLLTRLRSHFGEQIVASPD
jgi:hypothetical protein